MITATQAKQLYDESGAEVEQYLKFSIEPQVIEAAKAGKRTVTIHLNSLEPYGRLDQVVTPIQRAVVSKLKELGYRATIELYGDRYVPRGLADDNGNGPEHQNFGILIGW